MAGEELRHRRCVIDLIRRHRFDEAEVIRHAIEHGGLDELPLVMAAVNETGALDYVRALAKQEADTGCRAISHLPRSNYKDALIELSAFAADRKF